MTVTPAIAMLGIVLALLVAAVVQWSRYLEGLKVLRATAEDTRKGIAHLIAALTEDFDGTDVRLSLREAKHYTANDQIVTHAAIDEIREKLGMRPVEWLDREQARRDYLATYHRSLSQQGPEQ